jgi:hypothetical protein
MIKYYVGVDDLSGRTRDDIFYRTLKDAIEECPRNGFDSMEEALLHTTQLSNEGYLRIKIFKVEEM